VRRDWLFKRSGATLGSVKLSTFPQKQNVRFVQNIEKVGIGSDFLYSNRALVFFLSLKQYTVHCSWFRLYFLEPKHFWIRNEAPNLSLKGPKHKIFAFKILGVDCTLPIQIGFDGVKTRSWNSHAWAPLIYGGPWLRQIHSTRRRCTWKISWFRPIIPVENYNAVFKEILCRKTCLSVVLDFIFTKSRRYWLPIFLVSHASMGWAFIF
jgi:hypothetical protein